MSGNRDEKWICVAHAYPSASGDSPGTPQPPAKKHITAARFIFNAILKLRMGQRGLWARGVSGFSSCGGGPPHTS